MNRGLYNSVSAIFTLEKNMNVKSQNISNSNTTGYKYDNYYNKIFNEVNLSYKGNELGSIPSKLGVESIETVFSQGAFMNTNRPLDLAISGDGFFKVDLGNGRYAYTRNGAFNVDLNGYLTDSEGHYIQGNNGKIKIESLKDLSIKNDGTVYSNGKQIDKITTYTLENASKIGNNYYTSEVESTSKSEINQGFLESSNVDVGKELTDVIVIQNHMTSNHKMLQAQDELNKRVIDSISK